jgi:hypothetical protein
MKRVSLIAGLTLSLIAPIALALTEVITYIPAHWVERDGSYTFYGTNNGPCGSAIFGVNKSLANFNEVRDSLILAEVKSYKADLVVEGCEGTKNTVTFAKVCRDSAYC